MPELPEVETTRRGIAPYLEGQILRRVDVREPRLRWPVPEQVLALRNQPVRQLRRRAKYLVIELEQEHLLLHLGMSGSLRVTRRVQERPGRHDHLDLVLANGTLIRFTDPRRFGALLWSPAHRHHPLLQRLGPEPLSADFDGNRLHERARNRRVSVKSFLMNQEVVVGVGNIYAQESLFRAGIHPARSAGRISRERYRRLAGAVREVLGEAIEAGGTTLRDFTSGEGRPGYFRQSLRVYGRAGQPCPVCGTPLRGTRQSQRATVYCPRCQR